jgi:transcriptional regulator with XRE-family HTH domain
MAAEKKPPAPRTPRHVLLGQAVKLMIADKELTQSEVAARCPLDFRQVNRLIQGLGNPTFQTILHACDGLGVTPGELMLKVDELERELARREDDGS